MIKSLLKKFHIRTESMAIGFFLAEKTRREIFRECGFDQQETLNLFVLALQFIMEKSLRSEECTKDDLAAFLLEVNRISFNKPISRAEAGPLARTILIECLQNNGSTYLFRTHDFHGGKEYVHTVRLIGDRQSRELEGRPTTYYMTDQGYRYMFQTQELEESMQITMSEIRLEQTLKRKNYGEARDAVDMLHRNSLGHLRRVEYFISQILENPMGRDIEEYQKIYESTFSLFKEQQESRRQLLKTVESVEDQLRKDPELNRSDKMGSDLENIVYVKQQLNAIIGKHVHIISAHQEMRQLSDRVYRELLAIPAMDRIPVHEVLLRPLENGSMTETAMAMLLRPLFLTRPNRILNPMVAYQEQKLLATEKEPTEKKSLCAVEAMTASTNLGMQRAMAYARQIDGVLELILRHALAAPDRTVRISEVYRSVQGTAAHGRLVPELKLFRHVVTLLFSASRHLFGPRTAKEGQNSDASLAHMLARLGEAFPELDGIRAVHVEKVPDSMVIVQEPEETDEITTQLRMPDLEIQVEGRP